MTFQIHALPMEPFKHLFELSDSELETHNAHKVTADAEPGFPCRISLQDAKIGEDLILVNYQHLSGNSPYAATHAIYVRKDAEQAYLKPGEVPKVISSRLISVRGFNDKNLMESADVVDGINLATKLEDMLSNPAIKFVDIHNAKQGCFAARATRI